MPVTYNLHVASGRNKIDHTGFQPPEGGDGIKPGVSAANPGLPTNKTPSPQPGATELCYPAGVPPLGVGDRIDKSHRQARRSRARSCQLVEKLNMPALSRQIEKARVRHAAKPRPVRQGGRISPPWHPTRLSLKSIPTRRPHRLSESGASQHELPQLPITRPSSCHLGYTKLGRHVSQYGNPVVRSAAQTKMPQVWTQIPRAKEGNAQLRRMPSMRL